jgi:hypothetical protein
LKVRRRAMQVHPTLLSWLLLLVLLLLWLRRAGLHRL